MPEELLILWAVLPKNPWAPPPLNGCLAPLWHFIIFTGFSSRATGLITTPAYVLTKFWSDSKIIKLHGILLFFLNENSWSAGPRLLPSSRWNCDFFWDILGLLLQMLTALVYLLTSVWGPIITSCLGSCICCQATRILLGGHNGSPESPRESSCWRAWASPGSTQEALTRR